MDIRQDFHIITTDNSFYRNLGLDILTTGSLVDWWDETQNRVIIENPQDDDAPRVLGERFLDDNISWMEFAPDGEYPTIGTYEEKTLENVLVTYSGILLACYELVDEKVKKLENLASLIKLNEIVSTVNKEKGKIFTGIVPGEEISNYPPEWQDVLTSLNLELMKNGNELLQKIKKSKSGYIDFTANPRFIIHPYGFIVEDSVKFKLLLLDDNNSEISKPGVAINDLKFSTTTNIQSGGENQQEIRAGSFNGTWNEQTQKWEAGNTIVYAKLIDDIARATDNVTVETLQNQDNAQALSQPSTENQVVPAKGSGIPFFPQDPNSLQWTPSYVLPANKRCSANEEEAKEKVIYEVYNFSSTRSYKKDELVLLTNIGGNQWSIMPLNEPPVEEEVVEGAGAEKWGPFTYFWTNSDFFFRDAFGRSFTPRDAETAAHYEYYNTSMEDEIRTLNGSTNYGRAGGYSTSFSFDTSNKTPVFLNNVMPLKNGYFQTTSFDYLDGQILGTNDYCRISTTNPNRRPDGSQIPFDLSQYASRNAAICGIFHGCIFPDGYTGFEEFLEPTRDYVVVDGNPLPAVGNFFMPGIMQGDVLPFNPAPERNQCRNATLANIGEELNYDSLVWTRAKNEKDLSIFSSATLDSVPADVMLNASLSGVNGSPIVPITSYKFHDSGSPLNHINIFEPLVNNHWAARIPETEDGRSDAFDFTPNNPNHIMFRPLKLEAYVQIDGYNLDYAEDLTRNGSHNNRWVFSAEAWRTQMDYQMPISPLAVNRNFQTTDKSFWSFYEENNPAFGPKWGGDVSNNLVYNYLHNYSYWSDENLVGSNGAMKWARNTNYVKNTSQNSTRWKGAKAFGVITASKTINATQSISLTTNNRYGMGAAAHGEFTISNGYEDQDRTWGNDFSDNSYRRHNITDLSVRIYHHHPVEQTIYDPRTFAVHHLNPHLALSYEHYDNNGDRPFTSGIVTHQDTEYYITYRQPLTDIDYRVPTDYKYEDNNITPIELNVGTTVFSDVSEQNGDKYPLPEEYWILKTDRVGKLLPYRWSRKVIKYGNFNPTNFGSGYAEGDIVGNTDYGIRLSVTPTGLVVVDSGSALPRSGLCKRGQNDGTIRLSGIQTANGEGFDAGVIGTIVEEIVTDPKPLLVLNNGQDITRISSDTLKPNHPTTGKNSTVEPLAIVDESKSTSIEIVDKSPNGQYDLFFHFHNDISHTWLASNEDFHGGLNNQTECVEQYVDLRISTF